MEDKNSYLDSSDDDTILEEKNNDYNVEEVESFFDVVPDIDIGNTDVDIILDQILFEIMTSGNADNKLTPLQDAVNIIKQVLETKKYYLISKDEKLFDKYRINKMKGFIEALHKNPKNLSVEKKYVSVGGADKINFIKHKVVFLDDDGKECLPSKTTNKMYKSYNLSKCIKDIKDNDDEYDTELLDIKDEDNPLSNSNILAETINDLLMFGIENNTYFVEINIKHPSFVYAKGDIKPNIRKKLTKQAYNLIKWSIDKGFYNLIKSILEVMFKYESGSTFNSISIGIVDIVKTLIKKYTDASDDEIKIQFKNITGKRSVLGNKFTIQILGVDVEKIIKTFEQSYMNVENNSE